MDHRTKKRILKLQDHLRNHYQELFDIHRTNIAGIRISRKIRSGRLLPYHAIIFHVISKLAEHELDQAQIIPPKLRIVLDDGTAHQLFTDVDEVGEFEFHYAVGDTVDDVTVGKEGTLGLLLTDGQTAYALTNYHVAGWNLMTQNNFYYDNNSGLTPDSLTINHNNGLSMSIGQISTTVDAAFIPIGPAAGLSNDLGNGNSVNNIGFINPNSLNPGDQLYAYRNGVVGGETVTVVSNSMCYDPKYKGITFSSLIALDRFSDPGDSGTLVVGQDFKVVGIVVGGDKYSYLIPYSAIYSFNQFNII